jgi:hypothetical protein
MNPLYTMILEIVLASLLLIVIAYCMRLDGKLKALRTGNFRMLEAAKELQSSVLHAENAVAALRRSAEAAGRDLQSRIDEARAVAAQPIVREILHDEPRSNVDFTLRRRSVL